MNDANFDAQVEPFPSAVEIEEIAVAGFANPASLFERLVQESLNPTQSVVHYLNIHVANTAFGDVRLKDILQRSDLVYCDGAGIVLGSKWLGSPLPTRLTAADWFMDMLAYFSDKQRRVYLLGGDPGIPEAAVAEITSRLGEHTVVGAHHGFILNDPDLQAQVIADINALQPDILIVGFGTPLQEYWIDTYRDKLKVPVVYAIGAVMDFVAQKVSRCPQWMGDAGFEWLYRLYTEPSRLGGRYVLGNPWFLGRIAMKSLLKRANGLNTQGQAGLSAKPSPVASAPSAISQKRFRRKAASSQPRYSA